MVVGIALGGAVLAALFVRLAIWVIRHPFTALARVIQLVALGWAVLLVLMLVTTLTGLPLVPTEWVLCVAYALGAAVLVTVACLVRRRRTHER